MSQVADQRRLATILAVDAVGYSGAAERDQAAAAKLVAALRSRIGELASAHGGRIFSAAGDGFMLEFPLASAGARFALALLEQTANPASDLPAVRIGAHIGEVLIDGDDLLGHSVNVAARLSVQAAPNGLVISEALRSQIHGEVDTVFAPLGPIQLSKMRETVDAHGYVAAASATADLRRKLAVLARRRWRVLAVGGVASAAALAAALWFAFRTTTYELEPMQLVAQSFRYESMPALSPDGRTIAYTVVDPDYANADLVMRAVDGGEETPLATAPDMHEFSPAFSPADDRIAYMRVRTPANRIPGVFYACEIMVRVLPNGIDRRVGVCDGRSGGPSAHLGWTPDGKSLVYTDLARADSALGRPMRIRMLDLDNGRAHDVVAAVRGDMGDFSPSISPDGARLAFVHYRTASDGDVVVVDLRSGRAARLVKSVLWAQVTWADRDNLLATLILGGVVGNPGAELWSVPVAHPEARRRLLPSLNRIRDPSAANGLLALTVQDYASNLFAYRSGHVTVVMSGNEKDHQADFSYDGSLAFISSQSAEWLYLQRPGETPRRLTRFPDQDTYSLHWSPDGQRLVFSAKRGSRHQLFLVDAASGVITPLHVAGEANLASPSWAPDGRSIVFTSIDAHHTRLMRLTLATGAIAPASDDGWVEGIDTAEGVLAVSASRRGIWRLAPGGPPQLVWPDIEISLDNSGVVSSTMWTLARGRIYLVDQSVAHRIRILSRPIAGGAVTRDVDVEGQFDEALAVDPRTGAVVYGAVVNNQADVGVIPFHRR